MAGSLSAALFPMEENYRMTMIRIAGRTAAALAISCLSLTTALAKDETKRVSAAAKVIQEIAVAPKKGIPPAMLKNASAIAIFPGAAKTDFMVSGKQADGMLLVHDGKGKWSAPVFAGLGGGTLGWQVVAGPMDIILVFKNRKSIDEVLKGKFTMNARQAVVIGPVGQSLKAASSEEQAADITTYTRVKGAFRDATVAGSTIQIDDAANGAFYGIPKVRSADIFSGSIETKSDDVRNLQKLLSDYAGR